MIYLSYKKQTGREVFFPNSTLSQGRNMLWIAGMHEIASPATD
jgi:hypothetical protein